MFVLRSNVKYNLIYWLFKVIPPSEIKIALFTSCQLSCYIYDQVKSIVLYTIQIVSKQLKVKQENSLSIM